MIKFLIVLDKVFYKDFFFLICKVFIKILFFLDVIIICVYMIIK